MPFLGGRKKGEIGNPEGTECVFRDQTETIGKMEAELTEGGCYNFIRGVGNHDDNVAVFRPETLHNRLLLIRAEKLDNVRFEPALQNPHPGHPFGAESGDDLLCVFILEHILAELFRLPLDIDSLNAPPRWRICLNMP